MRHLAGYLFRELAVRLIDLAEWVDPQLPLNLGDLLVPKADEFTVRTGAGSDVKCRWMDTA